MAIPRYIQELPLHITQYIGSSFIKDHHNRSNNKQIPVDQQLTVALFDLVTLEMQQVSPRLKNGHVNSG